MEKEKFYEELVNSKDDDLIKLGDVFRKVMILDHKEYLSNFSEDEICKMRELLYARKGQIFDDIEKAKYFESKPWYNPEKKSIAQDMTIDELLFDSKLGEYLFKGKNRKL